MRQIQRRRVAALFLNKPGEWVPLTELLDLRIAQFGARIYELKRPPFNMSIENKVEVKDGIRHSWYRYTPRIEPVQLFSERDGQLSFVAATGR